MTKKKIIQIAGTALAGVALLAGVGFVGATQLSQVQEDKNTAVVSRQDTPVSVESVSTDKKTQAGVTVHFKWSDSQPHVAYTNATTGEKTTNPGVPMKDEGNGWYTCTVPGAKSADMVISVPELGYQTSSFTKEDGEYWYDLDAGWYTEAPENYQEAEEEVTMDAGDVAESGSITIHYTADWDSVNLYAWNALPNDIEMNWPGKSLTKDADGYYSYTFPETSKVNFLFSGSAEQTGDYTIKSAGEYWLVDGKWTTEKPGTTTGTPSPDKTPEITPTATPTKAPVKTASPGDYTTSGDFRDETIYFLMTTRFYDGDKSNNAYCRHDSDVGNDKNNDPAWRGDFKGLIEKLDYIKALGFSAIWITPVVENDSDYDYHGYHAYNFKKVDSRYESSDCTYQDLINAAHQKGMKIIQDIVLNHTSSYGEENLLQLDRSINDGWERAYSVCNPGVDPENIYHHNRGIGSSYEDYICQTGTMDSNCVDLETENPKVYNYLIDAYTNYINMGVDAFRVDTVKHISRLTFNNTFLPAFKEAGGENFYMFGECCVRRNEIWNGNLPSLSVCFYTWKETEKYAWGDLATNEASVAKHFTDQSKDNQPTSDNAFLHGNDYHTPDRSQSSGLDMIDFYMHWGFKTADEAFKRGLEEDKYFNDSTWSVTYIDSHDYAPDQAPENQRFAGTQDTWAENLDLIFTFRGIPCIYYGSEIEFQKEKNIDDYNKALADTGRAYYGDHIEGDVNVTDFGVYSGATDAMAETLNYPLAKHIQRLNLIRRAVPALRKGQYSREGCNGSFAFKRRYTEGDTDSFVCVSISGGATFSGVPDGKYVDVVSGKDYNVSGGTLTTECSGKGNMSVCVLQTDGAPSGKIGDAGTYLK